MGFNRCYLKKSIVKSLYEKGGVDSIINLLIKYDSFSTEDCFFLLNFKTIDQLKKAESEIKTWLYSDNIK